jgi:5-methylcytosine-specific restriction endonuclease McrA
MATPDDMIEANDTGQALPLDLVDLRDPDRSCWYCGGGEGPFETEHQVPVSRGGKWRGNVVWACASCNHLKGSLTVEEFREALEARLGNASGVRR